MKLTHLTMRFFGALSPAAPRPADVDWAATVLTPAAYAQWKLQPRHDQRHTVRVARTVEARLAGTPDEGDPRWLAAALLHDIGKLDARLGVYGRVVATVSGAATGGTLADAWSEKRGFTRRSSCTSVIPRSAPTASVSRADRRKRRTGRRRTTIPSGGTTSTSRHTSSPRSPPQTATDRVRGGVRRPRGASSAVR
jgi:hypothetical protein